MFLDLRAIFSASDLLKSTVHHPQVNSMDPYSVRLPVWALMENELSMKLEFYKVFVGDRELVLRIFCC